MKDDMVSDIPSKQTFENFKIFGIFENNNPD